MATVTGVEMPENRAADSRRLSIGVKWTPLTTTNAEGSGFEWPIGSDRSIQVSGTFGTGGKCVVQGSNDGTNWADLNDPGGTAISIESAGIKQIAEITRYVRPKVTAGDGTTSLTAVIFFVGGRP